MNLVNDIVPQCGFLEKIVHHVLNDAEQYSTTAEVLLTKTTGIVVSTRNGKLENVEFNNNGVLVVNLFRKNRRATVFTNNLSFQAVSSIVNTAVDITNYTFSDSCVGIADKELLSLYPIEIDLFHPVNLNVELGFRLSATAEQTALQHDKRIVCSEGSRFNGYFVTKVFGNTHGMLQSYSSSQYSLYCSVIAESNNTMEQGYAYTIHRVCDELCSSEWVGTESAKRALQHLESKKINTKKSPVLFVSEVATSLFRHLSHAIHGDNVRCKSTFLLNDLGNQIFPSWISIKELPHILKGLGSAPFDSEGVQTIDRSIIKDGVLTNWLLNSYSARKMGLKSTGHADGIYNWCVSYKNINFMELVNNMHRGLIVTSIMGQGVNIVTGDYSRGVSGFWVDQGNIQYPVSEITISGNLREMFQNIDSISCDIEMRNHVRCGSVLINSMQISGI